MTNYDTFARSLGEQYTPRIIREVYVLLWFCSGRPYPYSKGLRHSHCDIALVMLETDNSGLFNQYHTCWCLDSWSRQGISRHCIDSIRQTSFRVAPLWIWSSSVEQNLDMIRNVNISVIYMRTQLQHDQLKTKHNRNCAHDSYDIRYILLFLYWPTIRTCNKRASWYVMMSIHANPLRIVGLLWWKSTCHQLIPLQMTSNLNICCFVLCWSEQTVEHTIELPMVGNAMMLM